MLLHDNRRVEWTMDPELKAKWVTALRSGEYQQTNGVLYHPGRDGYCCLGVLAAVCGVEKPRLEHVGMVSDLFDSKAPSLDEDIENEFAYLNDDRRLSFELIADVIEREL